MKIIGIFICMLLIITALSATGATNFQTLKDVWKNNDLEPYPITPVDSPGDIAIKIVGEVTNVVDHHNLLDDTIYIGDEIKGKYIYNSATPDSFGYPFMGLYEHTSSPYGIELEAGGFEFKTDPSNVEFVMMIYNDFYYFGDAYAPYSDNNLDLNFHKIMSQYSLFMYF